MRDAWNASSILMLFHRRSEVYWNARNDLDTAARAAIKMKSPDPVFSSSSPPFFGDAGGWIPVRVRWQGTRASIDWYRLGNARFTAPFFSETVARCTSDAREGIARQTSSLDTLLEAHQCRPGLRPSGFIFHMSRCGSTLVSQQLAALPDTIVISEAPPLDAILRAHFHDAALTEERRCALLRAMVGALGQPRMPQDKNYFIKFDAWNTMELALIRRAFPEVPWIFVHREPLEVMISHTRMRGSHMVPGVLEAQIFGLDAQTHAMSLDRYGARVLARICDHACTWLQHDARAKAIDYKDLPEAVWSSLLDFFGVRYTPADLERMQTASGFHAKHPGRAFQADSRDKQLEAGMELRQIVEDELRSSYRRLAALR